MPTTTDSSASVPGLGPWLRMPSPATYAALARACGGLALVGALVVLAAWGLRVPPFGSGAAAPMLPVPATAVAMGLGGVALLLLAGTPGPWRRAFGAGCAALVAAIGLLTLVERLTGIDFGIDLLLFADAVRAHPWTPPGRMAANTAAALAATGAALFVLDVGIGERFRPSEAFAAVALLLAFLALLGYAYDARLLYAFGRPAAMALPTAIAIFVLVLGILVARADQGVVALVTAPDPSGVFLRRLLPAALVVPVGLGWIWDYLRDQNVVSRETGASLFVAAVVGVFVTVLLVSARTVSTLVQQREALLASEQAARAEAEQANRAKADFLANMSHELRTPLNAIIGYADLLDMGLRGDLSASQREDVWRIRRSGQYLLGLINDTLNFARLEAGRVEIAVADVPVHETLAEMEALIGPQLRARRLSYDYAPCDPALRVRADRERLEQILVNLLTNACKFTEPDGHVALACERRAHHVRIVVRDTGRGIPREKLATIFEPFVQVDRHLTHESQQGVGLGLAISRDLARAMGGDIAAESEVGVGSTFVLTLPRAPNGVAAAEAPAARAEMA